MAIHSSILAGRILGQRSLVGYSPWGRKESDTTERLSAAQQYCSTAAVMAEPMADITNRL